MKSIKEVDNFNRSISRSKIVLFKKAPSKQKSGVRCLSEFYQMYKEVLVPIILELFQKIEEERTLLKTFYEDTITLIAKPDKDISIKEN